MDSEAFSSALDPIEKLTDEYMKRFRRGERPTAAEYAARYPELADRILALFPTLEVLEGLKPTRDDQSGDWDDVNADVTLPAGGGSPQRLGDYTLLRELGRGGMGIVYEAEHGSLKSRVALKVMHPRFRPDQAYVRRFRAEAQSAARLHHTNIVPVFDYGEEEGVCFYAMQYIAGVGLERVLDDVRRIRAAADPAPRHGSESPDDRSLLDPVAGPHSTVSQGLLTGQFTASPTAPRAGLPESSAIARDGATATSANGRGESDGNSLAGQLESVYFREVARLGAQVADALDYAHRQGVVHRDIKPSNLLLDTQGNVWVADFGLAKLVEGEELSRTHDLIGTLRFMAPERLRGATGPSGDIYSLGATLYELLTLKPAFAERDEARLINQIAHQPPLPLDTLDLRIPRDLDTLVFKALAKDPGDRFATAGDLRDELRRYLESRPIQSRPIGAAERAWRWCKRSPWLAGSSVAAALLAALLVIGSTFAAWTFRQDNRRIQAADRKTREHLFDALTAQAQARRLSHRVGQRFESLDALSRAVTVAKELKLPPERLDPLRDEAIACLTLPDLKESGPAIQRPPGVALVAFDATLTRYALRFLDGTIQVRRVDDGSEVGRFEGRGYRDVLVLDLSPDGHYLATAHTPGFALTVWDVDRGTTALDLPASGAWPNVEFSPDSKQIALHRQDHGLQIYDLPTGNPRASWRIPAPVGGLAFRADGGQIAILQNEPGKPSCQVLDVATGGLADSIELPTVGGAVAWRPDGTLAITCDMSRIVLWDPATGSHNSIIDINSEHFMNAAFDPTGTLLAANGWGHRLRLWDAVLGRPVLSLTAAHYPHSAEFSRDGRIVVSVEDQLTTYQVDPALEYRTLTHGSVQIISLCYHVSIRNDGRVLALGTDRGVALWDLARGTELPMLPIGTTWYALFEASGDLLTLSSGSGGWRRWPVQLDPERSEIRVGPPCQLPLTPGVGIAHDRLSRTTALACRDFACASTPERTIVVGPLDDCRYVAVSPDGEWLAAGNHSPADVQVWRLRTAERVADLKVEGRVPVSFSPDGKWLMTRASPCRLWAVGTWREGGQKVGGLGLCFSPDGRHLVVQDASKVMRLVETETGRTVARLESPDLCQIEFATFTPDGSRLVVSTDDGPAVHIWDFRAIRRQLARLGLDWNAPTLPEPGEAVPGPLRAVVLGADDGASRPAAVALKPLFLPRLQDADGYHRRGHFLSDRKQWAAARGDLDQAIILRPDDPHFYADRSFFAGLEGNDALCASDNRRLLELRPGDPNPRRSLAWLYVTGDADVRRTPEEALPLALEALQLDPKFALNRITVGAVRYRLGHYDEAARICDAETQENHDYRPLSDLFLAMSLHRLGRRDAARVAYERALKLPRIPAEQRPDHERRFQRLRKEAEAVLAGPAGALRPAASRGPAKHSASDSDAIAGDVATRHEHID